MIIIFIIIVYDDTIDVIARFYHAVFLIGISISSGTGFIFMPSFFMMRQYFFEGLTHLVLIILFRTSGTECRVVNFIICFSTSISFIHRPGEQFFPAEQFAKSNIIFNTSNGVELTLLLSFGYI
ncbi:hypothetical protein BCR42DRAFT_398533 [Absidia repens]|uniref:Uncharacterized protein n=1 Tax=Absidia repens TaxID=90262 RepID=A0A1X2HXL1_9FUNG|nr:hypothetical protein BCR42DRAFT_398533 [Absidia repens]